MSETTLIEIGEWKFHVAPLKVKKQFRAASLLGAVLLPVFAAAETPKGDVKQPVEGDDEIAKLAQAKFDAVAIREIISGLDRVPELYDLFQANTSVEVPNGSGGTNLLPLKQTEVEDRVFSRRFDLLVQFLGECVMSELSGFLHGDGRRQLEAMAQRFVSRTG